MVLFDRHLYLRSYPPPDFGAAATVPFHNANWMMLLLYSRVPYPLEHVQCVWWHVCTAWCPPASCASQLVLSHGLGDPLGPLHVLAWPQTWRGRSGPAPVVPWTASSQHILCPWNNSFLFTWCLSGVGTHRPAHTPSPEGRVGHVNQWMFPGCSGSCGGWRRAGVSFLAELTLSIKIFLTLFFSSFLEKHFFN